MKNHVVNVVHMLSRDVYIKHVKVFFFVFRKRK